MAVKKIFILLASMLSLCLIQATFADTCQSTYMGIGFTRAEIASRLTTNQVNCIYNSQSYTAAQNVKPVSGPWKKYGINFYNCYAGNASECVYAHR